MPGGATASNKLGDGTGIVESYSASKLRQCFEPCQASHRFNEKFIAVPAGANISLEEDLSDQLFNHSEKRLARVLRSWLDCDTTRQCRAPGYPFLSHETLAEMVGTTRSRITHFMNKFRKMGLIDYNGKLTVRTELLTDVVLHD